MTIEVDMNKELAVNRLQELEKLKQDLHEVNSENKDLQVTFLIMLPSLMTSCIFRPIRLT